MVWFGWFEAIPSSVWGLYLTLCSSWWITPGGITPGSTWEPICQAMNCSMYVNVLTQFFGSENISYLFWRGVGPLLCSRLTPGPDIRNYFWWVWGNRVGCQKLNPGYPHARHTPYLLSYCSDTSENSMT